MKKLITLSIVFLLYNNLAKSQGCIVIRNISGYGQYNFATNAFTSSDWQLNVTSRYFKAYKDYKLTHNQNTLASNESVVKSFSTDFTISRFLKNGWSLDFSVPISSNSRTADLEHGGPNTTRHTTSTFGLGDIRFTVYKWLFNTSIRQKGNLQVGLGIKFPTGDYRYQDYFYRNDSTRVLAPVNLSIQLGDGGTGIITALNGFYFFNKSISAYGNFYYLINPRDQSGVSTLFGRTATNLQIITWSTVSSVPDVYSWRIGGSFNYKNLAFSAGLREDGIPVNDLIGESNGVRRPGYNFSVEPGLTYNLPKASLYLYVPFIVSREIKQANPDAKITEITGTYTAGAGGSGDCQVILGVQFML